MNKNQYRLVFNQKFGMLVAVAEVVSSQSKGSSQGTTALACGGNRSPSHGWLGASAYAFFGLAH